MGVIRTLSNNCFLILTDKELICFLIASLDKGIWKRHLVAFLLMNRESKTFEAANTRLYFSFIVCSVMYPDVSYETSNEAFGYILKTFYKQFQSFLKHFLAFFLLSQKCDASCSKFFMLNIEMSSQFPLFHGHVGQYIVLYLILLLVLVFCACKFEANTHVMLIIIVRFLKIHFSFNMVRPH